MSRPWRIRLMVEVDREAFNDVAAMGQAREVAQEIQRAVGGQRLGVGIESVAVAERRTGNDRRGRGYDEEPF